MEIRVYRKWSWEPSPDGYQQPYVLTAKDELQQQHPDGQWRPIPIVESEKPEHPDMLKQRQQMEQFSRDFRASGLDQQVAILLAGNKA